MNRLEKFMGKFAGVQMVSLANKAENDIKPTTVDSPSYPTLWVDKPIDLGGIEPGDIVKTVCKFRLREKSVSKDMDGKEHYHCSFDVMQIGIVNE